MTNEKTVVEKKTHTKWSALEEARLWPIEVVCDGYKPYHAFNNGCHTKLRPEVETLVAHLEGGHGGGFMMKFRKGDKAWPGWKKFVELGLESVDFRCEVCDAQIPFHPMHIAKHMRDHSGKHRRVTPGARYNLTINVGLPTPTEEEAFEDVG